MQNQSGICSVFSRRADAVAFIVGSEKYSDIRGRVLFYQVQGGVIVCAEIEGLPQGERPCGDRVFGFHIHDGTACSGNAEDAFADAGGHYNPHNCRHPQHAGDLPPLFGVNGKVFSTFLTGRFHVSEIVGKTVIIHAEPDDFTTQPAGNAGERMACGRIFSTVRPRTNKNSSV